MTSVLAFVVVDPSDGVLTYDQLREYGFIGNTLEKEYLSGAHGIDGLINVMGNPPIKEFLEDQELKVAAVTTPWYQDGRLLVEPSADLFIEVVAEDDYLMVFKNNGSLTTLDMPGVTDNGQYHAIRAKVSILMATSTNPIHPFDLLGALDPEFVKPVKAKKVVSSTGFEIPVPGTPNIPPPPAPSFQAQTPPPVQPTGYTPPPPAPVAAPSPHGALLSGIRNMHKQFEDNAKKARAGDSVDNNKPLHKQMFKLF